MIINYNYIIDNPHKNRQNPLFWGSNLWKITASKNVNTNTHTHAFQFIKFLSADDFLHDTL